MYLGATAAEQPHQDDLEDQPDGPVPEESSLHIIMNVLTLGLSMSIDERIVRQTYNLLSGIFQSISGSRVNQGF